MPSSWPLPEKDPWSTPFAQLLMHHLELHPGDIVLDIAAGGGIPAFHMAECVGPEGRVLAVDIHQAQVLRAKSIQRFLDAPIALRLRKNKEKELQKA